MLGFVVIVILYAVIGFMAAAGATFIARKILCPQGRADLLRECSDIFLGHERFCELPPKKRLVERPNLIRRVLRSGKKGPST